MKRNKAPGPDEIPMEFLKELNNEQKEKLLELINEWWFCLKRVRAEANGL